MPRKISRREATVQAIVYARLVGPSTGISKIL